jgi:hypothetical protein
LVNAPIAKRRHALDLSMATRAVSRKQARTRTADFEPECLKPFPDFRDDGMKPRVVRDIDDVAQAKPCQNLALRYLGQGNAEMVNDRVPHKPYITEDIRPNRRTLSVERVGDP